MDVSAARELSMRFNRMVRHDADEVGVTLPQLCAGLSLPCLYAVFVQAINSEVDVLDGVNDVVVDVSVQALQAVVHRFRYLVLREAQRLPVDLHGLPCLLHGPNIVTGPAYQRQHHGVKQAGVGFPLLNRLERRFEVGYWPSPCIPGVVSLVMSMSWWYRSQTELLMGVAVISTTLVSGLPPRMISIRAR